MSLSVSTFVEMRSDPAEAARKDELAFVRNGPAPARIETHASYIPLARNRAWTRVVSVRLSHVDNRALRDAEIRAPAAWPGLARLYQGAVAARIERLGSG